MTTVNNWREFYSFVVPLPRRCRRLTKLYRHLFSLIVSGETNTPVILKDKQGLEFIRIVEFSPINKAKVNLKYSDIYPLKQNEFWPSFPNKFSFSNVLLSTKEVVYLREFYRYYYLYEDGTFDQELNPYKNIVKWFSNYADLWTYQLKHNLDKFVEIEYNYHIYLLIKQDFFVFKRGCLISKSDHGSHYSRFTTSTNYLIQDQRYLPTNFTMCNLLVEQLEPFEVIDVCSKQRDYCSQGCINTCLVDQSNSKRKSLHKLFTNCIKELND